MKVKKQGSFLVLVVWTIIMWPIAIVYGSRRKWVREKNGNTGVLVVLIIVFFPLGIAYFLTRKWNVTISMNNKQTNLKI